MSSSSTHIPTGSAVGEGVRNTIAAYCHALDDGRTEEIVQLFAPDGRAEIPGRGVTEGHVALRELYRALTPTVLQRHLVLNTVVTEGDNGSATAVSDLVYLMHGESGWTVSLVGRYEDRLVLDDGGRWVFEARALAFTAV